jgi:hypothetical protein
MDSGAADARPKVTPGKASDLSIRYISCHESIPDGAANLLAQAYRYLLFDRENHGPEQDGKHTVSDGGGHSA